MSAPLTDDLIARLRQVTPHDSIESVFALMREAAEALAAASAEMLKVRADAHGDGQLHAIADVNAGLVDDLIAPRLAAASRRPQDYPQNLTDAMNEERWRDATFILIDKVDALYKELERAREPEQNTRPRSDGGIILRAMNRLANGPGVRDETDSLPVLDP